MISFYESLLLESMKTCNSNQFHTQKYSRGFSSILIKIRMDQQKPFSWHVKWHCFKLVLFDTPPCDVLIWRASNTSSVTGWVMAKRKIPRCQRWLTYRHYSGRGCKRHGLMKVRLINPNLQSIEAHLMHLMPDGRVISNSRGCRNSSLKRWEQFM